ncbi:hypothetical protein [Pseudomonas fluorescens]|uniref:hypothetical protein n=1 Tax=Pseudomonas fluorescens TaxID=294 RepID=UPI0007322B28|nr:hypothetical protein [Pseudomonas fluorescens]
MERNDFEDFVQEVLDGGHLDGSVEGIAQQVVAQGLSSLSKKQEYVFQQDFMGEFHIDGCGVCSNPIPWSEMYEAYHNGGNCSYCDHGLAKLENE